MSGNKNIGTPCTNLKEITALKVLFSISLNLQTLSSGYFINYIIQAKIDIMI